MKRGLRNGSLKNVSKQSKTPKKSTVAKEAIDGGEVAKPKESAYERILNKVKANRKQKGITESVYIDNPSKQGSKGKQVSKGAKSSETVQFTEDENIMEMEVRQDQEGLFPSQSEEEEDLEDDGPTRDESMNNNALIRKERNRNSQQRSIECGKVTGCGTESTTGVP